MRVFEIYQKGRFDDVCWQLRELFLREDRAHWVDVGEWQAIKNPDLPMSKTIELQDVSLVMYIPDTLEGLQEMVKPNLPWAEDHFSERVSGKPLNPPPSHEWWPFAQKNNKEHMADQKFSHTYPERMWPRHAGSANPMKGIRYEYGDLDDVIDMLIESPGTRQAYLPIWFPEDTGAVHGGRVPCTLGYHFLIRQERLHITYYIRSCDFYRHFRDDVYMAARLAQWVVNKIKNVRVAQVRLRPGRLTMHIVSLHVFQGDEPRLVREVEEHKTQQGRDLSTDS